MSVKTFECQIVRAQIGRYLSGEALSDEAQSQMEAHIEGCEGCSADLAERRSTLQALLTKPETNPALFSGSRPVITKPNLLDLIRAKTNMPTHALIGAPEVEEPVLGSQRVETALEQPKPISWKPLAYSGALAVVLIVMSTVAKEPTRLFGPRVDSAIPAASAEPSTPLTIADVIPAPFTALVEGYEKSPALDQLTLDNSRSLINSEPTPEVAVVNREPRATVQPTPRPRPRAARRTPRRTAPAGSPNSVRVVPPASGGITIYNP